MAQRPLEEYRRKRDFSRTAEPAPGRVSKRRHQTGGAFVIQKHAARALHYDFRLEIGGVLASWAVPKGPSLDPADKRLAVRTEDHPMEYGGFEGTIPEGEYGGGTVMVWDRGRYIAEGDPVEGLKKGKLSFRMEGKRVKGGYTLVQMHGPRSEGGKNWLLIKERDSEADGYDLTARETTSVKSGRSMDEIATRSRASWHSNRDKGDAKKSRPRAKRGQALRRGNAPLPDFIAPELATLVEAAPAGDSWLHETKFDGYRIVAAVTGDRVRLYTRHGKDWTQRFQPVAQALQRLDLPPALLDGEVVVLVDAKGHTDFGALQRAMEEGNTDLSYYVFDLLKVGGEDLRALPLIERKKLLKKLLGGAGRGAIRFSEYTRGNGPQAFARACRARFEGIVSKRADSTYRAGERTRDWLKVKCVAEQEFVIGGWSESERREGFASLLLGAMKNGKLVYAGRVGAGYDEQDLARIGKRLRTLEIDKPAFVAVPTAMRRKAHWVKPELVAQVRYTELTRDGIVRHGVFEGLREDKPAREVRMERAVEKPGRATGRARRGDAAAETVAGVRLTHPDKVLYPKMGITKRDLAEYFAAATPRMLPHVKDRPVSLVRCPDGRRKACFFQRHANEGMPPAIGTVPIREKEGKADYLTIRDAAGLVSCAQIGALELHIWGVHIDDIERPDRLVFDLDPAEDVPFATVREAAAELKDVLASAGLTAYAMVTGGKGVHLVIPIQRRQEWPEVSAFTKAFAERIVELDPEHFVATMAKARRKGKIFIDHFRNTRSASAIAPWSTRAKDGAPVAMPVTWAELKRLDRADAFSLADALQRLKGKDPWEGYFKTRQSLTAKTATALGLKLEL
jgi:bifunctional non-homologous end joining protein LigD